MGCSDDVNDTLDDATSETQQTALLTITVPESYKPAEGDFFFITTAEGKLLGSTEISGTQSTITTTEDITDQRLVMHRFLKNASRFWLRSWMDWPAGMEIEWAREKAQAGKLLGFTNVSFKDIPKHDQFYLSPTGQYFPAATNDKITYRVEVFENFNEAYAMTSDGNQGSYKLLKDLSLDKDYRISLAEMNSDMQKLSIDLEGMEAEYAQIWATQNYSSLIKQILFEQLYLSGEQPGEVNAFVPTNLTAYPYQKSYIVATDPSKKGLSHAYRTYGFIDQQFKKINAQINSYATGISDLKMEASGTFDQTTIRITNVSHSSDTHIRRIWRIVSPDGKGMPFPSLPDALASKFPGFNQDALVNEENGFYLIDFELGDNSLHDNYEMFIADFATPPSQTPFTTTNYRQLYDSREKNGRVSKKDQKKQRSLTGYTGNPDPSLATDVFY
ncbi:MAG: hypothetical protein AAGA66_07225 [Bacteroidota bacterium]